MYYIAEQNMDPGLKQAAELGHRQLIAAQNTLCQHFKANLTQTWAEARGTYAVGRASRGVVNPMKTGSATPFDPQTHIRCRAFNPPLTRAPSRGEAQFYQTVVYFQHPAATALNYGLEGASSLGPIKSKVPRVDWWRYKPLD
jgi:hypothetical protein